MRAFIVLCIFATASAASLGYDYSRQTDSGNQNGGYNGYAGDQGIQTGPIAGNHNSAPAAFGPVEFQKEYFTFSAPESEFSHNDYPQLNNNLKRGLRVIFIKGPEYSGLENAALKLAKSAVEQHTAIYILNKQADIGDLSNKLNALNKNNVSKPEVHFVKYRTPADAQNAQRAIQNQYDGLNGRSSSHDGGVAPVLNFASKTAASSSSNNDGFAPAEIANAYLPVTKFV